MSYRNLDFDADKPIHYKELRYKMALKYEDEDISLFGGARPFLLPDDFDSLPSEEKSEVKVSAKKAKELTNRGVKRIMEKVKEIRQNFSKAVVSGTRGGSGKIVFEYYDKLCQIWGGSANVEKLSFGVSGEDFDLDNQSDHEKESDCNADLVQSESDDSNAQCISKRPRIDQAPVLVDEKRKHLERKLSSAQRDSLLLREAKDDAQFKKDMCSAMHESTAAFSESLKEISTAMTNIAIGICRSVEVLSQAILHQGQRQQPINQNLFYQNDQIYYQLPGAHQQRMNYNTHDLSTESESQEQNYTNLR